LNIINARLIHTVFSWRWWRPSSKWLGTSKNQKKRISSINTSNIFQCFT